MLIASILVVGTTTNVFAEQGNLKNPVTFDMNYQVNYDFIGNVTIPTSIGVFISWINDVPGDNRIYYGVSETDVNNYVNGTWSIWDNDTIGPVIRITGLDPNITYYYKRQVWYSGVADNSIVTKSFTTLRPGIWISSAEATTNKMGWLKPINLRTINISAAPLHDNGSYIRNLSLEASIYNGIGDKIKSVELGGLGPYYADVILPDNMVKGGYYINITGYLMAGELSVVEWGCSNCHVRDPSSYDAAGTHLKHYDTTGDALYCAECHGAPPPDVQEYHPSVGISSCTNCHNAGSVGCNECHQDILSQRHGVDVHVDSDCEDCHNDLMSIDTEPKCTNCHPRLGSSLTTVPDSIRNASHTPNNTVACGLCHNSAHDIRDMETDINTCKNCHIGIDHNSGRQCTLCHSTDPHDVKTGDGCIECHGTNYTDAGPITDTTLVDIYAFGESIHYNINSTPPNTTNNYDCWTCHYDKDMDRVSIKGCDDCHRKVQQWHGNANITTNLSELW